MYDVTGIQSGTAKAATEKLPAAVLAPESSPNAALFDADTGTVCG